ncbi:MAG TPA: haloacid dehalogenase type II [Trebonia sp.]
MFDVFGTTVDWWTGVRDQIADLCERRVVPVDAGEMTSRWREQFFVGLDRVRTGQHGWANLDAIHAEGLIQVLDDLGLAGVFDDKDQRDLVRAWHRLPAWAEVAEGIERLRARFTVCALSNGSFAQITNLIKNAGLHFDCVLGADISRHYKPDIEIYRSTIELLDVAPSELMMVAAHGWDLAGARAAGYQTAYVERPQESGPYKAGEDSAHVECDLLVRGFDELADTLGCP